MGHISDRADRFAKTLVPAKAPPDERSPDEKMADFARKWSPKDIKKTRQKVKDAR